MILIYENIAKPHEEISYGNTKETFGCFLKIFMTVVESIQIMVEWEMQWPPTCAVRNKVKIYLGIL